MSKEYKEPHNPVNEYSRKSGDDILNVNEEVNENLHNYDDGFYGHMNLDIKKHKQIKSKHQKSF